MTTLKEEIADIQYQIKNIESVLTIYKQQLKILEDSRVDCKHEFTKPMTNFEHEGGYCIHCGINELFAETLAFLKNKK